MVQLCVNCYTMVHGTSVTCMPLYILYAMRDIFQHQLRGHIKELLHVMCKDAASVRISEAA